MPSDTTINRARPATHPVPHDPASVVFRRFSDPDAFVAALPLAMPKFQIGGITDYDASVMTADLGMFRVSHGEASVGAAVHGEIGGRCSFLMLARPGAVRVVGGRELPFGAMYHPASNDSHLSQASRSPCAWFGISIEYDDLAEMSAALRGRDLVPSGRAMLYTGVPPQAAGRLARLGTHLARLAEHDPAPLRLDARRTVFNDILGQALTTALADAHAAPDLAAAGRHRRIMARLEAVGEAHPDEALTLARLCAMTGVNARTLNLISHNFMGMGPTQYLRGQRLSRVRRALAEADARIASVGDIAAAFGFWESGRFAGAYRAAFGESPSVTLRRG